MELIHKLCCLGLVDLIKNDKQKTECFFAISTTVLGWIFWCLETYSDTQLR